MENDEGLRRDVGLFGLLWISAGTTLGSGWLFGAFVAVTIAGPAALVGWLLASVLLAPLVLLYGEFGAMFPESGGPGRLDHHASGTLTGATFGRSRMCRRRQSFRGIFVHGGIGPVRSVLSAITAGMLVSTSPNTR